MTVSVLSACYLRDIAARLTMYGWIMVSLFEGMTGMIELSQRVGGTG